jgi:hypothetical protein
MTQTSYSHAHTDLEGFVCPICGWCVPKFSITEIQTNSKNEMVKK